MGALAVSSNDNRAGIPCADHADKGVGHGDDAGGWQNIFLIQAIGLAAAIPTFPVLLNGIGYRAVEFNAFD